MPEEKVEVKEAKRIDPENEAARYLLKRLITNTAKFKVLTEPYSSYQNPAYPGGLKTDKLFFGFSGSADSMWYIVKDGELGTRWKEVSNDIYSEDRSGYTIRAIPTIEFWLFPFLATSQFSFCPATPLMT